jgi:hypothetical protein
MPKDCDLFAFVRNPTAYRKDDPSSLKAMTGQDGEVNRTEARRAPFRSSLQGWKGGLDIQFSPKAMTRQDRAIPLDTPPLVENPGLSGQWGASLGKP